MAKQTLLHTNKYLRDKTARDQAIRRSVISSSVVEGIDPKRLARVLPNPPITDRSS